MKQTGDILYEFLSDALFEAFSVRLLERERGDAEYAALQRQCDTLYDQIHEKLGPDSKLISDFESAANARDAIYSAWVYALGLRDCVRILQWMGVLPGHSAISAV